MDQCERGTLAQVNTEVERNQVHQKAVGRDAVFDDLRGKAETEQEAEEQARAAT